MRPWSARAVLVPLCVVVALAGCGAGGADEATVARDRAKAQATWRLTLEDGGAKQELPLERMDVFLTEDEAEPEIVEIRGDGVVLVGAIPAAHALGYGEAYDRVVGKSIPLTSYGGDPSEPKYSSVTLGGLAAPVAGGSIRVEKVTGKWNGSEGDKTLHGTVELRVPGTDGERVVRGRIAVHIVTWG